MLNHIPTTTLREEREHGVGEQLVRGLVAAAGSEEALLEQSAHIKRKGASTCERCPSDRTAPRESEQGKARRQTIGNGERKQTR